MVMRVEDATRGESPEQALVRIASHAALTVRGDLLASALGDDLDGATLLATPTSMLVGSNVTIVWLTLRATGGTRRAEASVNVTVLLHDDDTIEILNDEDC